MIFSAEFWSPASNILVFGSTLLVLIGLVLEGELKYLPSILRKLAEELSITSHKELGERLVTLGVAGELLFGVTAFVTTSVVDIRQKGQILALQERIAWRRLSPNQQSDIGSRLKLFANLRVAVWYNAIDLEASVFATDIAGALRIGQLVVQPPSAALKLAETDVFGAPTRPLDTGVTVRSTDDKRSRMASDEMTAELKNRGFDATKGPSVGAKAYPFVEIWVEPRPGGPQGEAKLRHSQ